MNKSLIISNSDDEHILEYSDGGNKEWARNFKVNYKGSYRYVFRGIRRKSQSGESL
ncbi:hypothetical protein [Cyanobacterium sp. Dongsha4]|uniref:hypothetical protein n=1 Tax=Cyanobacterium sp. DS4 TaxID=2878255 RepID=UPI002E81232E|nr:hypothetical protein [Cyanobacterium sp. Dongsha4]WVL00754.1 hypothetical protein Dongsha4_00715 [Cyanobacterium sp. Dongsha4]